MTTHDTVERFNIKQPFFGRDPPQLVFPFPSHLTKYNIPKNEAKASTSQSWTALTKITFHWMAPLENSMRAATWASVAQAIPNKIRKTSLYCQNLTLEPSPSSNLVWQRNFSQPLLIFFHKLTPYVPTHSLEHHPPHELPYLESTSILHQASLLIPIAPMPFT